MLAVARLRATLPHLFDWFPVTRAIVTKELIVVSSRRGYWGLQSIWLALLIVILLLGPYLEGGALRIEADSLAALAAPLLLVLYIGGVLLAPALTAGALQDERDRGMLEVLASTPVSTKQLLLSIVGARLLLVAQSFVVASPILLVPFFFGNAEVRLQYLWAALVTTLAAMVTALYGLDQFISGLRGPRLWGQLLVLLVFTPGLRGCMWVMGVFGAWILGSALADIGFVPFQLWQCFAAVLFPFWILGGVVAPHTEPSAGAVATASVLLLFMLSRLVRNVSRSTGWWIRTESERSGRATRTIPISSTVPLRRILGRMKGDLPQRPGTRNLATRRFEHLSPVRRWIYHRSRNNPMVAMSVIDRSNEATDVLTLFVLVAAVIVDVAANPWFPATSVQNFAAFGLFLCTVVMTLGCSNAFPTRSLRSSEVLLSTPLTAPRVLAGSVWLTIFHCWPIIGIVVCVHGISLVHGRELWLFGSLLQFFVCLGLVSTLLIWVSFFWPRHSERVVVSAIILAALAIPGMLDHKEVAMLPGHPFRIWKDVPTMDAQSWLACGTSAALLAAAMWAYATAYRRLV